MRSCLLLTVGVVLAVVAAWLPGLVYQEVFDVPDELLLDSIDCPAETAATTMVITGANGGLGLETVRHLAFHHCYRYNPATTIIMACRSVDKCSAAKDTILQHVRGQDDNGHAKTQVQLVPMSLDLARLSSIHVFAQDLQRYITAKDSLGIDILIHNAGIAGASPDLQTLDDNDSKRTVEMHMQVNHLGAFYLTHCLWPLLQASSRARVVLVSSLAALWPHDVMPLDEWYSSPSTTTTTSGDGSDNQHARSVSALWKSIRCYSRSKLANLMFAHELQLRYGTDKFSVVAAHPGFSRTNVVQSGWMAAPFWLAPQWLRIRASNQRTGMLLMEPDQGSIPQVLAALLPGHPYGGKYLAPQWMIMGRTAVVGTLDRSWNHAGFSREQSTTAWDHSLAILGLTEFGLREPLKL